MKKKHVRLSFLPNKKARLYLERLGYIDGRTGRTREVSIDVPVSSSSSVVRKKKTEISNVNALLNQCLIRVFESSMHPRSSVASSDELREAFILLMIEEKVKSRDDLQREIIALKRMLPSEQEYAEAVSVLPSPTQLSCRVTDKEKENDY